MGPLTGRLSPAEFWQRATQRGIVDHELSSPFLLRGFDTARHPALNIPDLPIDEILLLLPGSGPDAAAGRRPVIQTEALHAALADTLPRMGFPNAVVSLEGALCAAQGDTRNDIADIRAVAEQILTSNRAKRRLGRLLGFASPHSESPGESLARVRFHELGIVQPQQQVILEIDGQTYRLDFLWDDAGVAGVPTPDQKSEARGSSQGAAA